jgi:CRP/FNR family cyclic AMP-dependent transcriptional regulator
MVPAGSLAATQLLRGLEPAPAEALAEAGRLSEFGAGALVLGAQDQTDEVFFVLKGGVRVVVLASGGREIIFTDHGPGEQFGELAAIDQAPRSATVTTLFATQLLVLPGEAFRAALAASPIMSARLLAQMTARIRRRPATISWPRVSACGARR